MQNKKVFLIISIVLIVVGVFLIMTSQQGKKISLFKDKSKEIIEKMDKKESFNLLITGEGTDQLLNSFNYISDTYDIPFVKLNMDNQNESYKKLLKRLDVNPSDNIEMIFDIIKEGVSTSGMRGVFSENQLKDMLIKDKQIKEEYKDIDRLIEDDYEDYYKSDIGYSILYISQDKEDIAEYRKLLVKNKIKSLVMYPDRLSMKKAVTFYNEQIDSEGNIEEKLPAVIKTRNGKIEYVKTNVTLDNLIESTK